jgi:3-methyladenine DNA glycosylase Tag
MARSGPEGVSPEEIFPFPVGKTPPDDRAYFEMLTWFVFGAGLNWRLLRSKWPNFAKAFDGFEYEKVARYTQKKVERLMADSGIVRNEKKVLGTIENARELVAIVDDGGMTRWLRSYRGDGDALIGDVKKRFHHMGDVTARMFLTCAGAIEYQTWQATARQKAGRA